MTTEKLPKITKLDSDELRLTPNDFHFNEAGDLVINYTKVTQIIESNSSSERKSIKSGVSPIG